MDLSPQNKNFLEVIHKLGIDLHIPDKTFDGLFDNVPENLDYFFNWFIENITPDNVLNLSDEVTKCFLAGNELFPSQEEISCVLASHKPTYEELQSLDTNYINILLPGDLMELRKNSARLSEISEEIDSIYCNIKEKRKIILQESNSLKNQLVEAKENFNYANSLFDKKLEEAREVLLHELCVNINFDQYKKCLEMEDGVFDEIEELKIFNSDMCDPSELNLSKLREDFAHVETSLTLTQGFLIGKKKEIEVLSKVLLKKSFQESLNESLMQSQLINDEDMNRVIDDIKVLESKLFEKYNKIAQNKVDKIEEEYFLEKTGICDSFITQLNKCKNCLMCNNKLNEALLEILSKTITDLENKSTVRKNVHLELEEWERNFTNSITNLELQNKRFREVSIEQQHPLLEAMKNVINTDRNFAKSGETLNNIMDVMSSASGKLDLENLKFSLKFSIKQFFDHNLCGPTSEVLLTPVYLLVQFMKQIGVEESMSHQVKQFASSYVETKDLLSKSDRKSLLLWIKFLTKIPIIKKEQMLEEK